MGFQNIAFANIKCKRSLKHFKERYNGPASNEQGKSVFLVSIPGSASCLLCDLILSVSQFTH